MKIKLLLLIKIVLVVALLSFGSLIRLQNLFHTGFYFDLVTCFHSWGQAALNMGIYNFWAKYNEYFDYLPGAVYLLMAVKWVALWFGNSAEVFVTVLKIVNWWFDLIFIGIIAGLIARFQRPSLIDIALIAGFIYILPSYWFISAVWGQIDGLVVVFTIIALLFLYLAMKTQMIRSVVWSLLGGIIFASAFWTKLQAVLFVPTLILIFISYRRIDVFKYFSTGVFGMSLLIVTTPIRANPIRFFANLAQPFLRENMVSRSADTLWTLVGLDKRTSDFVFLVNEHGFLTIGILAIILFGIVGLLALLPFIKLEFLLLKNKFKEFIYNLLPRRVGLFEVFLFSTFITLGYFVLMPRMYERYLVAATMSIWFAFATAKSRIVQRWLFVLGTVLSIGHFINLIMVYNWWQPDAAPAWVSVIVKAIQFDANNFAALLVVGVLVLLLVKYKEFINSNRS